MKTRHLLAATAALALASTLVPAHAAAKPTVTPVAKNLLSPLSVAQAPDGTRYWTDNFASMLWKQSPGGQPTVVYEGTKKGGVESVSADHGMVRFTTGAPDNSAGKLMSYDPASGAVTQVADLYAYEQAANPDKKFSYGYLDTPKKCTNLLAKTARLPEYKGIVESHPYATATAADGTTYVADAGGNSIVRVSPTGSVSTAAVIKPATVKITRRTQTSADLPPCLLGKKVSLESVPTDVEIGPDGQLYVTSFGGGPEDGRFGTNSYLTKVDLATGETSRVGNSYASLTGVAVSPTGDIYLSDLFTNKILIIRAGESRPKTYVETTFPAAVEWTPAGLLATIKSLPGKKPMGQVVTITP